MKTDIEKSPALIDTNILVYAYAEDSPKSPKAADILSSCFAGKTKLALSLQNIGEFCDVALKKYKIDIATVQKITGQLLGYTDFIKVSYTEAALRNALQLVNTYKIGFWDAVLAATMRENAIDTIYSEDNDFWKVPGIKAVNPFTA
ncbi:MAG TPA: PIN domain-containing protein [Candidatus Nanoarchaeia archaeon]|nr:PIN domain-containing protein [Candidatus Nanoarchaeia archaeon]